MAVTTWVWPGQFPRREPDSRCGHGLNESGEICATPFGIGDRPGEFLGLAGQAPCSLKMASRCGILGQDDQCGSPGLVVADRTDDGLSLLVEVPGSRYPDRSRRPEHDAPCACLPGRPGYGPGQPRGRVD